MNYKNIILLLSFIFASPLFCNTADIFREMLPLSMPIEAQDEEKIQGEVSNECIWQATFDCRAQIKALRLASAQDHDLKMLNAQNCLWNSPCAKKFKQPGHLS